MLDKLMERFQASTKVPQAIRTRDRFHVRRHSDPTRRASASSPRSMWIPAIAFMASAHSSGTREATAASRLCWAIEMASKCRF